MVVREPRLVLLKYLARLFTGPNEATQGGRVGFDSLLLHGLEEAEGLLGETLLYAGSEQRVKHGCVGNHTVAKGSGSNARKDMAKSLK